jgi:hypothetical protein
VTDWRAFDEASFNWFKTLLNHDLPSHVAEIAFKLYEQDKSGKLQNDGLSRGIIALELVTRLIGSYEFIQSRFDFKRLGIIMQIVDDVLDYENDRLGGELNCLITSSTYQRNEYIRELLNFDLEKFRQVFPYGTVLYQVIRYSKGKVKSMFHYDCTTPPMQLAN